MRKFLISAFLLLTILSKAQTTASLMSMTGRDINDVLNSTQDGTILLRFVNIKNRLIVDAFAYDRNSASARKFKKLKTKEEIGKYSLTLSDTFYIVTLRWKYDEDAGFDYDFDNSKKYYLIPLQVKNYILYVFSDEVPTKLSASDFNNKSKEQKEEIMLEVYKAAAKDGGAFNPIPPKLVP